MTPEVLVPWFAWAAPRVMFLFGLGFLVANLNLTVDLVRYQVRKRSAVLIWPTAKPRSYGFGLGLGLVQGLLLAYSLFILRRPLNELFGLAMMFVYYGYAAPLSARIARGFYRDGIWFERGFIRWAQISAVSWKEDERVTLIVISHARSVARHLDVPGHLYGEARRLLRDKVKAHDIHIGGAGLDLGSRDETDAV